MTDTPQFARLSGAKVINGTFRVVGDDFATFLSLALIFGALPNLIVMIGLRTLGADALRRGGLDSASLGFLMTAAGFLAAIPGYVATGAITHGAILSLGGRRAGLMACIETGLGRFVPLALVGLLVAVAGVVVAAAPAILLSMLGAATGLSIIVSAIIAVPIVLILITMTSAAPPVVVAERAGVFRSLRRSAELTKGNRFRIFWLALLAGVLSSILGNVAQFIARALAGPPDVAGLYGQATINTAGNIASMIANALATAVSTMIGAAGAAALYFELRVVKEGAFAEDLAKVFD